MLKDVKRIRGFLLLVVLMALTIIACNTLSPKLLGNIIGTIGEFTKTDKSQKGAFLDSLTLPLIELAIVYTVASVFSWLKMFTLNNVVSRRFTCELRIAMSDKISRLPVSYLDKTKTGELIARVNNNVSTMGNSIHEAMDVTLMGVLQLVVIAVMLVRENWKMALAVLLLMPLSTVISTLIAKKSAGYFGKMWTEYEELYSTVEESYGGIETVKSFNMEKMMGDRHKKTNEKLVSYGSKAIFWSSAVQPVIAFTNHASFVLICLLGGIFALKGTLSVTTVVTVILYSKQFSSPLSQIADGLSSIQQVSTAAKKVYGFLEEAELTSETEKLPEKIRGEVEFLDVSFSYTDDKPLIEHLCFTAKPGQKVAIVGPTGAGKTTLVNLLMRFYEPKSGCIKIDGVDIASCNRENVRDKFSMVLQDTWLFEGSVYENVAYGKEHVGKAEIEKACENAYCDYFISLLPNGYDTVLNDGTGLSGGQKQLLTIARAFLSDKPLLILDEATSAVDTRTELLIQRAMDKLMKGKTCFVIAHRLSTIVNADVILAVDNGKIVDIGTHKELLEKGGFYADLYLSQYKNG